MTELDSLWRAFPELRTELDPEGDEEPYLVLSDFAAHLMVLADNADLWRRAYAYINEAAENEPYSRELLQLGIFETIWQDRELTARVKSHLRPLALQLFEAAERSYAPRIET